MADAMGHAASIFCGSSSLSILPSNVCPRNAAERRRHPSLLVNFEKATAIKSTAFALGGSFDAAALEMAP